MEEKNQDHEMDSRIVSDRFDKLARIREKGIAYRNHFHPDYTASSIFEAYQHLSVEELEELDLVLHVAGRMMLKRLMGRASFAVLQDATGKLQVYVSEASLGSDVYEDFKTWDVGDICFVSGSLFRTKTDELTLKATHIELVSKCLRPLPEKFHGLTDQEKRYRNRCVDLIMNESTRQIFLKRSRIVSSMRRILEAQHFLEVETPMMHPIPGGAAARPFVTHHHALDRDLYLRVAPELYLKRLLVGGFDRVFEINRNFRNEGISPRHNPEFTMLEMYAIYMDYKGMMVLTEKLIRQIFIDVLGTAVVTYQGQELDLSKNFERLTILEAIQKQSTYTEEQLLDRRFVLEQLQALGVPVDAGQTTLSAMQLKLFEQVAEAHLWNPTFIMDYPVEISPLSRSSDHNPQMTERFELFVAGRELANGFSELNDPEDQAARFQQQVIQKNAGNEEAMYYDADYVNALEYGMPPAAGCGIGVDRLVMLLTNTSTIREVIFFPHLKSI